MKRIGTRTIFAAGLLTILCTPIAASDQIHEELPDGLLRCMDESDELGRLHCYDLEMALLTSTTQKTSSSVTEDRTAEDDRGTTAGDPEEWPGKSDDRVEQELPAGGAAPQREYLTATIVKISKRGYGELVVSLENGQVWAEKIPNRSIRLSVGDNITIRQGRFGGYRLFGRGKRSTEVTRIQ